VLKTYLVKVSGKPDEQQLDKLRAGIKLPAERKPLKTPAGVTMLSSVGGVVSVSPLAGAVSSV